MISYGLALAAGTDQSKGYTSALWGTYQQWQSLGGQVRKGEHGSPVVYWGTYDAKEIAEDEQDERNGRHLFCKGYTVTFPVARGPGRS